MRYATVAAQITHTALIFSDFWCTAMLEIATQAAIPTAAFAAGSVLTSNLNIISFNVLVALPALLAAFLPVVIRVPASALQPGPSSLIVLYSWDVCPCLSW